MKRVGYLFEKVTDLDNLYEAYLKAIRGKRGKPDVVGFAMNAEHNLQNLKQRIENDTVEIGRYRYFTIYDPKERLICAAHIEERILHHALMNVCRPYFENQYVDKSYATRIGKGVYAALDEARSVLRKNKFVAKLDVRKYYDTIRHDVLKRKLFRLFKDRRLLSLFNRLIDSYDKGGGRGLPIGNLTSQYFANLYLSRIDRMMMEHDGCGGYVRYMDDVLIGGNDRSQLLKMVGEARSMLAEIGLELKPVAVVHSYDGVSFLGYHVFGGYLGLNSRSKRRFRHKLGVYTNKLVCGDWSQWTYKRHIVPMYSFVQKTNENGFFIDCMKSINQGGDGDVSTV